MLVNTPDFKDDPDVIAMTPAVSRVESFVQGLVIKSAGVYEEAAFMLKSIKGQLAAFEAARVKITKPINDGLREINAQHKLTVAPLLAHEQQIKRAMIEFSDAEDRRREEEQRKSNEIARKERERLQAIADEADRKARAMADEKRREAEKAAADGRAAEAAKLNAQAARVEERAAQKVEAFEDRANQVMAPIAQQAAPKVGGIAIPKIWAFEISDASLIPREYLVVDETKIRKVVAALKGGTVIPGVRVYEQKRVSAGMA